MSAFLPPLLLKCSSPRRPIITPRRPPISRTPFACATATPTSSFSSALKISAPIDPTSTDTLINQINPLVTSSTSLPQSTLESMVVHLADSRGMSRLALVEAFGHVGSAAVPILLTALSECTNPVVRRSCGKALAKIGDGAATEALIDTLVNDKDTVTRSSAAGALARMGSGAVPRLLELIGDEAVSMTAKGHAAWALAFMQGDAGEKLFEGLEHQNKDVRVAVVNALGGVAIGDCLPMMGGVGEDDWEEPEGGRDREQLRRRAIAGIKLALGDRESEVRMEATTALANAGCVEEVGRIVELLGDTDVEMRRCAALSLIKLRDCSVVGALRERERDEGEAESVRRVAKLAADCLERARQEEDDWESE